MAALGRQISEPEIAGFRDKVERQIAKANRKVGKDFDEAAAWLPLAEIVAAGPSLVEVAGKEASLGERIVTRAKMLLQNPPKVD